MEGHAASGMQGEVDGISSSQQVETKPVGVVGTPALVRGEEALGRRIGADDERDLTGPREDLPTGHRQCCSPGSAGGIGTGHLSSGEAECPGEGAPGHVARISATHGDGSRDEAHVAPVDSGIGDGLPCGVHSVVDEVPAPLSPGVHTDPEDGDLIHQEAPFPGSEPVGRHCQVRYAWSSSS